MAVTDKDSINWQLINDYEFVYLAADLLSRLGFVEVHVQGDGPDGGLDLIATELLPFAIQGSQPFRWGVQCKFSKSGTKRSVGDGEIKDVEGILRSSRYAAYDLRGYMVITNRRIVQNVIERLQGIDHKSPFRTAFMDGLQFRHRLNEHQDLVNKYFGEIKSIVRELGSPIAVAGIAPHPEETLLDAEVSVPLANSNPIRIKAVLDTGTEVSAVPSNIFENIPVIFQFVPVTYGDGPTEIGKFCRVNVRIGGYDFKDVDVLAMNTEIGLIGRDILKHMVVLLDGPGGLIRLWSGK